MNRLLIISYLTIIGSTLFGQTCETKTDPFTNKKIATFEWKVSGLRYIQFEDKDSVKTFEFRHVDLTKDLHRILFRTFCKIETVATGAVHADRAHRAPPTRSR